MRRRHVIEQHFATSKDGTSVPYFLVRPKDLALDGTGADPAVRLRRLRGLADAGVLGQRSARAGWSKGGVYARGQHPRRRRIRPALAPGRAQANRHKAYEDFAAVARRPGRAQGHLARSTWASGRQQRRPADRQHADAVSGLRSKACLAAMLALMSTAAKKVEAKIIPISRATKSFQLRVTRLKG